MRVRKLGTNVVLLVTFLFISLMILEVGLRIFWNGFNLSTGEEAAYAYDDTLGWTGPLSTERETEEPRISYRYNSFGFRDVEFPNLESDHSKRGILFLGDSYIEGVGLTPEQRISDILEELDPSIRSYNFGLSGYSTDQELLVLKKFGPLLDLDHVLLFFCVNDLYYIDSELEHGAPKPHFAVDANGTLVLDNVPLPEKTKKSSFFREISSKVALLQLTTNVFAKFDGRRARREVMDAERDKSRGENLQRDRGKSPLSGSSELAYALLRELKYECHSLNAGLTIIAVPSSRAYSEQYSEAPEEMKQVLSWCEALEIDAIDLYPIFNGTYLEKRDEPVPAR